MEQIKKIVIIIVVCINTQLLFAQNITVNDSYTAQQLVENVLINSSCANVSNSASTGDTYTPGKNSFGYFNNAGGSFPFKEGVILNTWSITNAIGPYIPGNNGGGDPRWKNDPDLDQALGFTNSAGTVNATVLEFDFTPLTNFISFNYIFASNEYQNNFSCNFSDAFAFLIKEKGSTSNYQNIAFIPNTTTPVSSINIHPQILSTPGASGCAAKNATYFNGFNTATSPVNYAGQTVVMNAQTNVIINKTYHIKLVIEDHDGRYYDSAVFLQSGSFDPKINIGQDRLLATNTPICFGDSFIVDTKLPNTYSYKWFKDGSTIPIPGETNPSYLVTQPGIYTVEVQFLPSTCKVTSQIKIEFTPEIKLNDTTLTQCDTNGNGISQFDLTKSDNFIRNNDSSLSPVVYYESLSDAKAQINPILNPGTYTNKPTIPTVFARVTNAYNCVNYAQVKLKIANYSIVTQKPISTCDDDGIEDGFHQFDLNSQITPLILTGLPSGLMVNYYTTENDAVLQKNSLPNLFTNAIPNQQIIYARIINGPDCYGVIPITLNVNRFVATNFQDEIVPLCNNNPTTLSIPLGYSSYLWSTGDVSNFIIASIPGNYSVIVTDVNGCTKTKNFTVTSSDIAVITDAIVSDFDGSNNAVVLQFTGTGNYEFSLDGLYYQDTPTFTGVVPGNYKAFIRDTNGCNISAPYSVYVLDYPRFFTPNGDNYNDNWKIKNLDILPSVTISIFNRYGKLLKELNTINPSWNGTFIDKELPADDYWFHINFNNGKIIKGHFSLKR